MSYVHFYIAERSEAAHSRRTAAEQSGAEESTHSIIMFIDDNKYRN